MKKLIAAILFFASFGVAQGAQPLNEAFWFSLFPNLRAPSIAVRSLNRVADTLQNCGRCYAPIGQCSSDMGTTQDDINKCNAGNTGVKGDCEPLVSQGCAGSSERNTCKPICKKIPPPSIPRPVPQPRPVPNNCLQIEQIIKSLKNQIARLPDNDYFRGLRSELENRLQALEKKWNYACPKPDECKVSKIKCNSNKGDDDCADAPKTPKCIIRGSSSTGVCGSKSCEVGKCLSSSSKIATPRGDINVTELKVGDMVWTTDTAGNRIVRPILKASHISVTNHRVVHLVLADGRTLDVSATHPAANGRMVGDLITGDTYNGSTVKSAMLKPYEGTATYDILPAGDTGFYFANGILMGSTLK